MRQQLQYDSETTTGTSPAQITILQLNVQDGCKRTYFILVCHNLTWREVIENKERVKTSEEYVQ